MSSGIPKSVTQSIIFNLFKLIFVSIVFSIFFECFSSTQLHVHMCQLSFDPLCALLVALLLAARSSYCFSIFSTRDRFCLTTVQHIRFHTFSYGISVSMESVCFLFSHSNLLEFASARVCVVKTKKEIKREKQ